MSIRQIELKCETVTPLFMSGADGMTPELRAPSIKALIRYWWRAANADLNMDTLIDNEKNIFGGTGKRIKQNGDMQKNKEYGRSKVEIRVKHNISSHDISESLYGNDIKYKIKQSERGKRYKAPIEYEGICYLLYSTILPNKERKYIKADTNFSIVLTFNDRDKKDINEFLKGFIFLEYFGALGTRSRRGAGSFRVLSLNGDTEYIDNNIKDNIVMDEIDNNTEVIKRIKNITGNLKKPVNENYSVLKGSKILVFDPKDTWKDALEFTGSNFKEFRGKFYFRPNNDIYSPANFGLPIMHKKRDNKSTKMGAVKGKNYKQPISRRSSPLIFKVIKTEENVYFPVIIYLSGEFLPKDYAICNINDINDETKYPNRNVVDDFLNTFGKNDYEEMTI